ncbi:site-specific DNA-methyltransferase [Flavobacterium filum]|uniref:site-specific DNA-methyltransferase n=1 Tax=Flavobacterium filum TaxID=370974 RepID=UPI0023F4F9B2|nr:site-specific DNA-methyltransferase [Flavobacterium filum]
MAEQDFIKAGFTVVGTETSENKLLSFLKEHYPNVIRDTEINLEELKTVLGLPIDEKVNGYGLNFVGRNFARAKYAQKTEKELRLNNTLSKNIDTTENIVLKGDNLDSLKILKNHYSGQIKCIYIDPPYNTTSEEFVYPDKFDKEEAEVLGLANLSESDFARMDFSFKTKKSHNGWLAFMYPRLLLARDLLTKDGVIFISIDDNEQANLKLLCDDVFGEENFVGLMTVQSNPRGSQSSKNLSNVHEYIFMYAKSEQDMELKGVSKEAGSISEYTEIEENGRKYRYLGLRQRGGAWKKEDRPKLHYSIFINPKDGKVSLSNSQEYCIEIIPKRPTGELGRWTWSKEKLESNKDLVIGKPVNRNGADEAWDIFRKDYFDYENGNEKTAKVKTIWIEKEINYQNAKNELKELFANSELFDYPKPTYIVYRLISMLYHSDSDIILDFFAGSGTTGHAVMQLNAEDGGNRKFILCQIDEPIKEGKPAYQFCIDNNLPPVISSITVERIKRAGEKIASEIEAENSKTGLFEENKKQVPDIGFKVFDSVEAPKLTVDETGQITFPELYTDTLSRIYNMIFTVGLDEPTQVPEEVVKDSIYKIGNHYYITNSEKVTSDDYSNAIKNARLDKGGGKVFVDGWTASLNGTLQNYKEDVKIVF